MTFWLLLAYGFLAGYLLVRLRRSAPRLADRKLIVPLGWLTMAASLTLALGLIGLLLWRQMSG